MTSSADAIQLALVHHQAGRLPEAEALYRSVLAVDRDHGDALHLLGRLAQQCGRLGEALDLHRRATEVVPGDAVYRHIYAEALRASGRLTEAVESYRLALRLQRDYPLAWRNLGCALVSLGELDEAEQAFRTALQCNPAFAECCNDLAGVLRDRRQFDDARRYYERALALRPIFPEAHNNLGNLCLAQGDLASAIACYRQAISLQPDGALWHLNLADALQAAGQIGEALAAFQQSLRLGPDNEAAAVKLAELLRARGDASAAANLCREFMHRSPQAVNALTCLGTIEYEAGRIADAEACFQQAVTLDPRLVQAQLNLGYACKAQGKLQRAVEAFEAALRSQADCAEAHNSLAVVWALRNRPDRVIQHCRAAIAVQPDFAMAHGNLAGALHLLGRYEEALAEYRRSIELDPADAALHGNLLYAMHSWPAVDTRSLAEEHFAWGAKHADPLTPGEGPHRDRTPRRRLRIGYVSPYFTAHAVNSFVEPILASHDHDAFEIYCYSDVASPDDTTRRLQGYADKWRSIVGQPDVLVCRQIEADQIDLLVDLSGHIGGNRLLAFARRPAPVQITYLGYQNTTGMRAMDYRLTDAIADPPGVTDAFYTERLWRLPGSFFTYLPATEAPPVSLRPPRNGSGITFGSFNNFMKITPQVLVAWQRILERVPESRLVVLTFCSEATSDELRRALAGQVSSDRVTLIDRLPYREYLELMGSVDISLDTFPFNGHTTVCDALWMGTPVVALAGETYVSRYGTCALATLGLHDLIAHNVDAYVEIAVRLALDRGRLGQLQSTLRDAMAASPLLDAVGFTRNLETAYRQMWHAWCASAGAT